MKKVLSLLLVALLIVGVFGACNKTDEPAAEESATEEPVAEESATEEPEEEPETSREDLLVGDTDGVRTGLGVITTMTKSKDATDSESGLGQVDTVIAAVLLDNDGTILDIKLDSAQSKIYFTAEGTFVTADGAETTPEEMTFLTKLELGDDYGMRAASPVGNEWDEQNEMLAQYLVGKKLEDIQAFPLNEDGAPDGIDAVAGVTMTITGSLEAVEKAIGYAQNRGASADDKLGLGVITTAAQSKVAEDDADGIAQAYSTYVAATVNAEGAITSTVIEASQGRVTFDTTGVITSNIEEAKPSKRELGEDYGMRAASPIGKEWDEQANALASYMTGKTLTDVDELEAAEELPTDLSASVTIGVTDIMKALDKAIVNAQTAAEVAEDAEVTEEVVEDTGAETEAETTEEVAEDVALEEGQEEEAAA